MAQFFSADYFQDLQKTLNNDPDFKAKTANVNSTILMVNRDTKKSFLLKVERGTATIAEGNEETKADFTFIGDTATWVANHKGEAPMEKLVLTGKLKFKGSIPKIMGMKNQLNIIDRLAQTVPAEMPA
ncbi:MAG TPA: SCP2 sterol-binding domain-containing protein [Candidatus Thermoplasmatota archaeon]|nr:SCP2 sterol-binding domain-containing protein [Candidatus Thermoplasmatota archaeon]